MIETPQSILNERGSSTLPLLAAAARGRCVAAHFGTYDYTASCNITAEHQSDDPSGLRLRQAHDAGRLRRHRPLALGRRDERPPRAAPPRRARGPPLTPEQIEENRAVVHRAWKLHAEHVRHSLVGGFYQGWDLHPAQLVTRYAALYAFFLEGLDAASDRLRNFVQKAAQATLVGEVFDDAATGQGLLNYFLRAINCGAITEEEALERSGLTLEELRGRSFVKILGRRSELPVIREATGQALPHLESDL